MPKKKNNIYGDMNKKLIVDVIDGRLDDIEKEIEDLMVKERYWKEEKVRIINE